MSKRLSTRALCFAMALLFLCVAGIVAMNVSFSVVLTKVSSERPLNSSKLYTMDRALERTEDAERGLVLSGWLSLPTNPTDVWSIYIPNGQNCCLYLNGECFTASPDRDAIIAEMEVEREYRVEVVYPEPEDPLFRNTLIYLASVNKVSSLEKTGSYQRFFIIGISFALLLYALSLYSGKKSEKYLLWLAFLTYSTVARTLWNALPILKQNPVTNLLLIGTIDFPWIAPTADYNVMFLVIKLLIFLLRFRLIREFVAYKEQCLTCIKICAISFIGVLFLCVSGRGYYPTQIWLLAMHLMELQLLVMENPTHSRERYYLILAWAITTALRFCDFACVIGWMPHGFLEAAIKPQGIIETFYIIGFVVVINSKFAAKFREADRLSHSLEESNQNLERIVEKRTEELSDTCNQLQEIQEQKSEFMANIVHNLKSPLFSLYGYTDMALDCLEEDPEHARYCLQEINKNTDYARQLIEKLFLCMRLESSSVKFNKIPFPAEQLLEQVKSTSTPNAEKKSIRLVTVKSEEPMPLYADLLYLRQAMQNIVDNAIRHSPSQSVITLRAFPDGEMICLSIEDEGEGMTEEQQKQIFGRYYSLHKNGATSSGLGLTIAMEIVSQHGGTIKVTSEVNKGSHFDIYLKRCPEEESAVNAE